MQLQSELPHRSPKLLRKRSASVTPLEAEDDVRIASTITSLAHTSCARHPQRSNTSGDRCWQGAARSRPLRSTRLRVRPSPFLHHPSLDHFWIRRRMRWSATRCSTNLIIHALSRLSKKPLDVGIKYVVHLSFSRARKTNASSALCWLRPGRKPYEKREVLLIDVVEDVTRVLDDLVFQ